MVDPLLPLLLRDKVHPRGKLVYHMELLGLLADAAAGTDNVAASMRVRNKIMTSIAIVTIITIMTIITAMLCG